MRASLRLNKVPDSFSAFCPLVPIIPILGIAFCLLLMFSLPVDNWLRLIVWLVIGFAGYFVTVDIIVCSRGCSLPQPQRSDWRKRLKKVPDTFSAHPK